MRGPLLCEGPWLTLCLTAEVLFSCITLALLLLLLVEVEVEMVEVVVVVMMVEVEMVEVFTERWLDWECPDGRMRGLRTD